MTERDIISVIITKLELGNESWGIELQRIYDSLISEIVLKQTVRVDKDLNVLGEPENSDASLESGMEYRNKLEQYNSARQITKDDLIKELRDNIQIGTEYEDRVDEFASELQQAKDQLKERDEVIANMKSFIRHHPDCPNVNGFVDSCTCGYKELLNQIK